MVAAYVYMITHVLLFVLLHKVNQAFVCVYVTLLFDKLTALLSCICEFSVAVCVTVHECCNVST